MGRPMMLLVVGLLVALGCHVKPSDGLRILALFPLNSNSHNAMCERLTRGLAAKGHQLDVYSPYPPKKPIANYKHHSLEGILPTLTNNMKYKMALQFQAWNPRQVVKAVADPSCKLMELPLFEKLLKNPPKDPPYDLVIVEVFLADCYLAWGRHLDVPMVGVMTSTLIDWYNEALGNPLYTAIMPGIGTSFFTPTTFWHRLQNAITTNMVEYFFTRAIREELNEFVERLFGPDYPNVDDLRRDLDLLIVNSHFSLDGINPLTPAIVPTAAIHIDEEDKTKLPQNIQKWLDDSEHGCIYFSFGSMVRIESFPLPVLQALYRTFKNIAPVRVLLKAANPKMLPVGLPLNVMVRSWFPQIQVLKHNNTKVFVTHGGLMSIHESVYSAVPMVSIPIFGDQHSNVDRNVKIGIATSLELSEMNEEKLTAAIKEVLYKPWYKENVEKLSRLFIDRPMKPLDTAIYWVEYVARHGKNCLRSPLVDMPWWQASLLDVNLFIVSVLIVTFFLLRFFINKIFAMCCVKKTKRSSNQLESKKRR